MTKHFYLYLLLVLLSVPIFMAALQANNFDELIGLFFVILFSFGLMINGGYSLIAKKPLGWFRFIIGLCIYLYFIVRYFFTSSTDVFYYPFGV